ncbi:hypothetical protein J2T03_002892 [Chryseobacterium lathyri]|nr:hypothetical protein [Chryseobacterium lathyri]
MIKIKKNSQYVVEKLKKISQSFNKNQATIILTFELFNFDLKIISII